MAEIPGKLFRFIKERKKHTNFRHTNFFTAYEGPTQLIGQTRIKKLYVCISAGNTRKVGTQTLGHTNFSVHFDPPSKVPNLRSKSLACVFFLLLINKEKGQS